MSSQYGREGGGRAWGARPSAESLLVCTPIAHDENARTPPDSRVTLACERAGVRCVEPGPKEVEGARHAEGSHGRRDGHAVVGPIIFPTVSLCLIRIRTSREGRREGGVTAKKCPPVGNLLQHRGVARPVTR